MFWLRFEARLLPKEESEDDGDERQPVGPGPGTVQPKRKDGPAAGDAPKRAERAPGERQ
jgi:hypothetical protein